ncbi:hypothetical protein DFH11DRAFT_1731106 [Phellopilus nigrolimitatus]|nr:hypothetical protein DFH11DRAFT_1731106 [Phellopilus nigrolimitatus]
MLCDGCLFLVAGTGMRDVLGWGTGEMMGHSVREFICVLVFKDLMTFELRMKKALKTTNLCLAEL